MDGELVKLDLTMMYADGSHIADDLEKYFISNLNQAGIRLTPVPVPMDELFRSYYRETERTADMLFLGTNFGTTMDPSIAYSTDTSDNHQNWNNFYSDDEELYYLAVNMRRTDPRDVYDYVTKWVAFQERYNEVLPAIPIYSNIYYDLWTDGLTDYFVTAHATWVQAILEASFTGREDAELADGIEPELPENDQSADFLAEENE